MHRSMLSVSSPFSLSPISSTKKTALPGFSHSSSGVPPPQYKQPMVKKPILIGIFGLSGCGKSYLLNELRNELGEQDFAYFDGSDKIAEVAGTLDAFKKMKEDDKTNVRRKAVEKIKEECFKNGQVGIVTGHSMLWESKDKQPSSVWTTSDAECYTHIIFLNVDFALVEEQRSNDKLKERPETTAFHLQLWQETEISSLRKLCLNNSILFTVFSLRKSDKSFCNKVLQILDHICYHNEAANDARAICRLDEIVALGHGDIKTMLVLDGDRTLAPQDTGSMFWKAEKMRTNGRSLNYTTDPLTDVFCSPLGYSYEAFCQASLLYEEIAEEADFNGLCDAVATGTSEHLQLTSMQSATMSSEMLVFLREMSKPNCKHICIVVVTCGLQRIWEKVLAKEGLSGNIKVIGGGRCTNSIVVTGSLKATIVSHLQAAHRLKVWAFGDSILDLGMLQMADHAVVVIGDESTRSKSLDTALPQAMQENTNFRPRQLLLSKSVNSPFEKSRVPQIQLTNANLFNEIHAQQGRVRLLAADTTIAQILQTPMRDAKNSGVALREAHRQVGRYLATEFLSTIVGTEPYSIEHVQSGKTEGYRFPNEAKITIIACMRGGEPMAFGVNDAMPLAMFVHSHDPTDLKSAHFSDQSTVVLVDSVVNHGKTVVEYVKHIRSLGFTMRIIVVAGVVQAQSVDTIEKHIGAGEEITVVALRKSDNQYTGKGSTDTGNRLFNTTHIP